MSARAAPRLFVEPDLRDGLSLGLDAAQTHYLRRVLRLSPGGAVTLFNGRDGEWLGRIEAFGREHCAVAVCERHRRQESEPDLWLVFAPIKRARIDFLVEKATELGVSELRPVVTRRTVVERINLERLRANAIEAAEQSERLSVPRLYETESLERLMTRWPAERRLLLCDESGTAQPIAAALAGSPSGPGSGFWAVLVGPEGGFTETELDALVKLPFVCRVGLGPRVLRSETAALAALAVLEALLGDWRTPRGR